MNSAIISAIVRHLLTVAGGGFLASWGMDGSTVDAIAGAVATLAGVAWSVYDKRQQANAPRIQND
jgi:threonine/homoserine efflux transporter RhtA